jgi:hypothetical protein
VSRTNCTILDTGNVFPELRFNTIDGNLVSLPAHFGDRCNILLFYRGHW